MASTLKVYLGKDLAKATALATAAFTLVITVFAVIEPLREQGLSGVQALRLFGYIMPAMFSLTLPIAALFATTIVYGRFSRDNELTACRASGIPALSLLAPAIWMGVIVSVITLILGFYVAPNLMFVSERAIKKNLQQITYNRLKKKRYFDFEQYIFHADRVSPDGEWVDGVVGVDFSDDDDARFMVAASAKLEFKERKGEMLVEFHPTNPTILRQSGGYVGMAEATRLRRGNLPSMKDKPKFYDWSRLWRAWANPKECPVVVKEIIKIKRQVCIHRFYEDVIGRIEADGKYERLIEFAPPGMRAEPSRIVIEAAGAHLQDGRGLCLTAPAATSGPSGARGRRRGVAVGEYAARRLNRRLRAQKVTMQGVWDKHREAVLVTLTLNDVTVLGAGERIEDAHHQAKYEMGPFAVPADIVAASERIDTDDLYENADSYSDSAQIRKEITHLRDYIVPRLRGRVRAEIHQRLAYGISCLLMVMLGAALGLVFRGGEVLVAFAISAGPALAVIMLMLMGKQLIANPGVPEAYGIAVIWGGIAALTAATLYVYAIPMRR